MTERAGELMNAAQDFVRAMVGRKGIETVELDSPCYRDMLREFSDDRSFTVTAIDKKVRYVLKMITGRDL